MLTKREQLQIRLFGFVLAVAAIGQTASTVHMTEAFGWANSRPMAVVLGVVTVLMSGALTALTVLSQPGRPRTLLGLGLGLLLASEWCGNFAVGGLLIEQLMPAGVAPLFFISQAAAVRLAAFLLAALFPVLIWLMTFALSEVAVALFFRERPPSPHALTALRSARDEEDEERDRAGGSRG